MQFQGRDSTLVLNPISLALKFQNSILVKVMTKIFFFPLYSKGVRLSLHVYITITVFPPPFLLLQHEYLDKVLNAIQQNLLVNWFLIFIKLQTPLRI